MKIIKTILKWIVRLFALLLIVFLILLILPEKETVPTIQPRENTEYWDMNGGFKIAYTQTKAALVDESKPPPIVFLHGGPGGYVHSSSIKTLGRLSRMGHDVFFYDQRGSGLSDRMEKYSEVSFEKHLEDLHEIITQKIRAEKVILIGQSFGSILIAHYSSRHPEHVDKLVFSSPGALRPHRKVEDRYVNLDSLYPGPDSLAFKTPYNFVRDVDNMALKPKAMIASLGALLLDKKLISDKQMDRMLNTLASQFTKGMVCNPDNVLPEEGGGGLYAYIATNSGDYPEGRSKIKTLDIPTLVLQGQCEFQSYGTAFEYVDLYKNSRYHFIENAGHEIWWEQQEAYFNSIARFISEENHSLFFAKKD